MQYPEEDRLFKGVIEPKSILLAYLRIIAVRLTFLTALKPIDIVVNINKILFFD